MTRYRSLRLWRRASRTAALFTVFIVCAFILSAQTPPYALFQQATLTGSGNTITATQIPVVTAFGATVYLNATLQFNVDANGNLTISSGFPQIVAAPTLITSGFKAGRYVAPSTLLGGKAAIVVAGPGVTDGGATQWTLSAASGADACTFPLTAAWYVGPIASNPLADRLKAGGITSTARSYGIFSGPNCTVTGFVSNAWYPGTLIGVIQVENTLTIFSYSRGGSIDYSAPQDQITYTLAPSQ
jgi:hypothetical protein